MGNEDNDNKDKEDCSIRIIIENKVEAKEREDQTTQYYNYAQPTAKDFRYNTFVFLTPDESQMPSCDQFVQLTYQKLCDVVIKPCLSHPGLPVESKYLLEQYLLNLRTTPKRGGRVMALPNNDLCQKIYKAHKDVLDEIFVSVKGEAPQPAAGFRARIRRSSITLADLISAGSLALSDTLHAIFKHDSYVATLRRDAPDSDVVVEFDDKPYESVTAAAMAVTGKPVSGWVFWDVKSREGLEKGSLKELRDQLDVNDDEA